MKKIRWGILGTGNIARKFASDLKRVEDAELIAAGSRSLSHAQAFCEEFHIPFSFGSYEALAQCDEVDIIYIATPHSLHHANTLLCLHHNKAVLCEKPFALNEQQAAEMIALAQQKQLFLMDALWTKCLPHYTTMMQMVEEGAIGEVKVLLANFGFQMAPDPTSRLLDPELGGGSLLDIGIYTVFTALDLLGKPDSIQVHLVKTEQGVDQQCAITFRYANGAMASLFSTLAADLPTDVAVCGTKGRIQMGTPFYEPTSQLEYHHEGIRTVLDVHHQEGFGYQYEARHATTCMRQGLTESPLFTHAKTLQLMQVLDEIRRLGGIVFPGE